MIYVTSIRQEELAELNDPKRLDPVKELDVFVLSAIVNEDAKRLALVFMVNGQLRSAIMSTDYFGRNPNLPRPEFQNVAIIDYGRGLAFGEGHYEGDAESVAYGAGIPEVVQVWHNKGWGEAMKNPTYEKKP